MRSFSRAVVERVRALLRRFRTDEDAVTEQDIYYCYRLLLGREPDPEGFSYWRGRRDQGTLTRTLLVDGILESAERRTRDAERLAPVWVDLQGYRMLVRRSDPDIGGVIARDHSYEPQVSRCLRTILREGSVFVDVGANIGYFSLLAASLVAEHGRVIAVEARADNVELLRRSALDNGFAQIEIHTCAAAERSGELIFYASGSAHSNGRVVREVEAWSSGLPRVRAAALDELLRDVPRIDAVKLDIEGSEPRALEGMRELVRRHRPVLLTEFSPQLLRLVSACDPADYLESLAATHLLYILPRDGSAELGPLDSSAILAAQAESGLDHLDLLARPR
jgi:FkbM family methyltransferase